MVNFTEIYHFSRFQRGPTFSRGVQLLFPIETHITCDFPRGGGPPLDPHLMSNKASSVNNVFRG